MTVTTRQRFTRNQPCPVCNGYETLQRGGGDRCFGFYGEDRRYAHCTRKEKGGELSFHNESETYAHRLDGDCGCGVRHDPEPPRARGRDNGAGLGDIVATSDYQDEAGKLLYQSVRFSPKTFRPRRPDGSGGWTWKLGDVRRVLYRLPQLISADLAETVFIVEGEKERVQVFQGVLISTKGRGINETITVRRIVANEGVERIFPLHSPRIAKIEVVRQGDARRSKLYFLRDRLGKARRLRDRRRNLK